MDKRIKKLTACTLVVTMLFQLLAPTASYALTSGPSQPEMQSFEPVGTTDMVNAFSGDFVYNIPLLDVEGYPVNIAYHSGITTEQEASWVGLGWNINPGNINHGIRGLPDDFDGETIEKKIEINDEVKKRFGMFFGLEVAGVKVDKAVKPIAQLLGMNIGGSINMGVNVSNYTGVSASLGLGGDVGLKNDWMSVGVNMGATFTTDNGVDLDKSMSASLSTSGASRNVTGSISGYFGKGYNSREGLKYTSFGVNPSFALSQKWNNGKDHELTNHYRPAGVNNTVVPISMQNFVPVITNVSFMESNFFQFKLGIETTATIYPNFGGSYGEDVIKFQEDGNRRAYGFFNLQDATKDDITDFTRDRDGRFSRDMKYLPPGNMTYDIYSVNGQGTAGNFRGFRNDIGTVYDPYTNSNNKVSSNVVEVGAGNIFEAGWDRVCSYTSSSSGPWNKYKNSFSTKKMGSLHEPHYFKQAGELTENSPEMELAITGTKPLRSDEVAALNTKASPMEAANLSDDQVRAKRANLLYYFTAEEASNPGVSLMPVIEDYQTQGALTHQPISRTAGYRKSHQASEFTQLLPDGRRYIYGIPAMNNTQIEYVVGCNGPGSGDGTVDISGQGCKPYGSNSGSTSDLGQEFYMKTTTPAYAHSYLLTAIVSPDYSDLMGDGLTDDDLGSYTKFNYTRKESNYRWRTPFQTGTAQYDKGVASDCKDDKATFIVGNKEIWMLHSIETKNYIAEFYTSERDDGKGSGDGTALSDGIAGSSYKLDKIILYNKKERLSSNPNAAVPIKTIIFTYDYSLCANTPNSNASADVSANIPAKGKLTLKAISIKFGNSDIGYLSPYRFSYNGLNPNYSADSKDMWGNYKPPTANASSGIGLSNHEFPFVRQDSVSADQNATAWNLTNIRLPSGGEIEVSYEADDYAYVQNRRSMEMIKVAGVGPDKKFLQGGTSLYQSQTNPYLYVYFKRKKDANGNYSEWYNDMRKSYLDNGDLLQFNFKVKMSANGERTPSCNNTPLEDNIKGYAGIDSMGICSDNADYGYIMLSPKNVDKMPGLKKLGVSNLSLNPVTLSAIFYAKYYNSKALYPSSEIVSLNPGPLIKQLLSSFAEIADYFRSPIAKYLNDGRAKYVNLDQSFIRLCSQGKKFGGGHRVKRIEFKDNWDKVSDASQPIASYGSDYDYTITDEASGRKISSGVATYEPMTGGDENPFKEPIATDRIGFKKDFPVVIPTELIMEGPIGESMYPSPDVGYSKVTVTSIHKSEGASSQTIQEHEFYTAKDFPVRTANTELEQLENKVLKPLDFSSSKQEVFRAAQGYALFFNDMHGKSKKESVLVAKGGDQPALVSYKKYEYFTNPDQTLNNSVPCMYFDANNDMQQGNRTLGAETDIMLDSREKVETTNTTGFMANLNVFMGPGFPIPIPTAFPKTPKSLEKTFSSIVSTKIVQQYGILKSVETFDKGAAVKLSNELFDPNTGQPLVTKVNTEHNDFEFQVKYPAYWAYRCMGAAYKNILYEEQLNNRVSVVNDTCFITTDHPDRFNLGDELLMTIKDGCSKGQQSTDVKYKLWVVKKNALKPDLAEGTGTCDCPVSQKGTGYDQYDQPLPDTYILGISAVQDPHYSYLLGPDPTFLTSTSYQPCTTTRSDNGPVPWITGNWGNVGITYFKTIVNVSDINKNSIKVTVYGDWDYTGGYPAPSPLIPPPPSNQSSEYYVNGVAQGVLTKDNPFTPTGLIAGQNTIIFKIYNSLDKVAIATVFQNCPESPQNAIAAIPMSRGAVSLDASHKPFPTNDKIYDARIKVIRSGRRNQLQETVQELSALSKSGTFNYSSTAYNSVLATDAQTFTEEAAASGSVATPASTYYNPYVTGRKGNYRILEKYNINLKRDYTAAIDPGKGILNAVTSFWKKISAPGDYYSCIAPGTLLGKWTSQALVKMYSPWGNDLEVEDAAGNIQSNLFGYGNSLPIASVKNSHWDNALCENFEDNAEPPGAPLDFYQNALHQYLKQVSALSLPLTFISSAHHTGSYALQVTGSTSTSFPVCNAAPASFPSGGLYPFHFRPGKKYIVSYWQQANQNTANLSAAGSLSLSVGSTSIYIYPKTPVIDGWVLYESEIAIPNNPSGVTLSSATLSLAPSILDDIRILPVEANMKSYVYNPVTRRLVAVLDENHMASLFEYDAEGKLVRVKKETEKGVLTLKESRSSLHHVNATSNGNGTVNLKQNQ